MTVAISTRNDSYDGSKIGATDLKYLLNLNGTLAKGGTR